MRIACASANTSLPKWRLCSSLRPMGWWSLLPERSASLRAGVSSFARWRWSSTGTCASSVSARGIHASSEGVAMQSIRIINDEHRSLAAVVHGMLYLVREIREHGAKPDFAVLGAMVYYIDAFPERFHHPKEDRYLFRILRQRCADAAPLLNRLESEHRAGNEKIRSLEQALARYHVGGSPEFSNFRAAVEAYA